MWGICGHPSGKPRWRGQAEWILRGRGTSFSSVAARTLQGALRRLFSWTPRVVRQTTTAASEQRLRTVEKISSVLCCYVEHPLLMRTRSRYGPSQRWQSWSGEPATSNKQVSVKQKKKNFHRLTLDPSHREAGEAVWKKGPWKGFSPGATKKQLI